MWLLWKISHFVGAMRRQMRFGELSRAPLQLLRLEWRGDFVECDWLARPADEWDRDVPLHVKERNVSEQALCDAIAVRELLFDALPGVNSASFRVFRRSAVGARDLIIRGAVTRDEEVPRRVPSTAMRAKLLGFQFGFEDGALETLQSDECAMSF